MRLNSLSPAAGSKRGKRRVGRGAGTGWGKTAGRGMKGQKSRSGPGPKPGFEGGQLPLIKGLPMKRGFTNQFKTYYSLVKLTTLEEFEAGDHITPEVLVQRGLLRNLSQPVKIVGDGEITKAVVVAAHKFTRSAQEKIEAVDGRVEEL